MLPFPIARHSASGSNIAAAAIRIATGTFSAVTNPQVPAAGAAAGTVRANSSAGTTLDGNDGSDGTAGQTGGGGSGGSRLLPGGTGTATSGAGVAGTSFGGGPAGGGIHRGRTATAGSGTANGGPGGAGNTDNGGVSRGGGGGAGNPDGADSGDQVTVGAEAGTGGVLLAICEGELSGAGSITAAGANGGNSIGGGSSGGGSVTILYGTDASSITPTALGGVGTVASGSDGGDGTARKLALA